jgi:hypothetical protein
MPALLSSCIAAMWTRVKYVKGFSSSDIVGERGTLQGSLLHVEHPGGVDYLVTLQSKFGHVEVRCDILPV